jgi:hypothetical protein
VLAAVLALQGNLAEAGMKWYDKTPDDQDIHVKNVKYAVVKDSRQLIVKLKTAIEVGGVKCATVHFSSAFLTKDDLSQIRSSAQTAMMTGYPVTLFAERSNNRCEAIGITIMRER